MRDANGHEWHVGDLCTYTWNELGHGVVYRVVGFGSRPWRGNRSKQHAVMHVKPIFGFMQEITDRKVRDVVIDYTFHGAKPIVLIDLAREHLRLANFINDVMRGLQGVTDPINDDTDEII
jgi:hypothetical protein